MAEFVEFRAEEWIGELEEMEKIHLFEHKEINSIATKRREFEYKIQRRTKCKEDFLKYIQFEVDLHRIIKARRKKTGIKTKRAEIDYSQTHRIANLFKQVIFKFQNDVKLWMSFFKFCEGVKYQSLVSQMLVRMLQIHANKPDLWVFAARWEFEQCKSINNARQFLTRGLRYHPSCDILYLELFMLEIKHIKQKEKEIEKKEKENKEFISDEVTTNIIKGRVAEVVYESAIKFIQGVDIKISMLNIAKDKRAPEKLKTKIFQDIVENHMNEELTWDTIAKAKFEGFSCDLDKLIEGDTPMEVNEEKKKKNRPLRDRIQSSINVYEEGIKKLNSVKMWSFYLDFVIKLNENVKSLAFFKTKLLNNAMEGAMISGNLAEKYYLEWIDRLHKSEQRKNKKLCKVLEEGTKHHPKSLKLWHARVKFYLIRDRENLGLEVFSTAIKNVTNPAPIWGLVVKCLLLKSSPKVEEVLQNGIKLGGEVAQTLKPFYVEWLAKAKGIEEARKMLESPEMNLSPCLELYKKMASLESTQAQFIPEKMRRCHELACKNFGNDDPSVWLEYVRFEFKEGNPSRVPLIHRRALKALQPEQVDAFVSEFNNFKMNFST